MRAGNGSNLELWVFNLPTHCWALAGSASASVGPAHQVITKKDFIPAKIQIWQAHVSPLILTLYLDMYS